MVKVIKQIRKGTPLVGVPPYGQIHLHSTGNRNSTAQNEADYMNRKDLNSGFYTHVVGNGKVIQVAPVNRGAYDVGGGWNQWGYASIELIESHKTKQEFMRDYKLYIELARQLADEAGISKKMDRGQLGIITHDYARRHQPYNATDHVDPYPYLKRWGISEAQLRKDIENGLGGTTVAKPKVKNTYWENGSYFEALQDLKTYDKNFKKVDNTVFLKKGSKFPVRNIQVSSTGTTHAFVAGLNNTCVTLAKSHVKKL